MSMPIKRGYARRLGIERPVEPAPFSWENFHAAMEDFTRRMREVAMTGVRPRAVETEPAG